VSGAALADTAHPPPDRQSVTLMSGRLAASCRVLAVGFSMFVLAAAIRLFAIDAYVTIDESRWVQRASDFSAHMSQGNLTETFIIGHPGVTTMWTALIGMGPERARHFSFLEGREDATRRTGYFEALVAARRPFALVGALGVAAVALLGWRLLGPGPGILGGLLIAFEPFLVAHARVAHLDSGLTTSMTIGALAALVYFAAGGSWPYLLLSGIATGLAFLTKAPSVYLVGFVPLAAGVGWLLTDRRLATLPRFAGVLILWGLVAAGVGVLLWPALRVDPIGTVLQLVQFTERVGGGEHDNLFLGRPTDDPGLSFYPFTLALRLAPVTLIGVVLAAVSWRRLHAHQRNVVLLLALYCLGFMAMMSIGAKKFDRYLLPIYPVLGLLAGLGLWSATRAVQMRFEARRTRFDAECAMSQGAIHRAPTEAAAVGARFIAPVTNVSVLSISAMALAVIVQAFTLLPVVRYPLAYYSPLLGGGSFADRLILVGWGEGLDQVGAWIDAQPRPLGEPTVATSYHRVLQAQLLGSAIPLEHVRMADYVVVYVNTLQRGDEAAVLAPFLSGGAPEHVVRINGIEYARVYLGPHSPVTVERGLNFANRVTLVRSTVAPGSLDVRPGEELTVGLRWTHAAGERERTVVAILLPTEQAVVQSARPLGADGPDENGQPGDIHRLVVPPRTPPGTYRLAIRVEDPRGRGLPIMASDGATPGNEWATLHELTVSPSP